VVLRGKRALCATSGEIFEEFLKNYATASRSIGLVTAIEGLFMTWV